MSKARKPAKDVAQIRSEHEVWIDHAKLTDDDLAWLGNVRWLTLWNVTTPPGLLAQLPKLEGLDVRGGSLTDLELLEGCRSLRCLVVNQVRGLVDLSVLTSLTTLQYVQLYGLKQVVDTPSLAPLDSLLRLDLGVMCGIPELNGLLDAPCLDELYLVKHIKVSAGDVARILAHPTLSSFEWAAMDVPLSQSTPVLEAIDLPRASGISAMDWYEQSGGLL